MRPFDARVNDDESFLPVRSPEVFLERAASVPAQEKNPVSRMFVAKDISRRATPILAFSNGRLVVRTAAQGLPRPPPRRTRPLADTRCPSFRAPNAAIVTSGGSATIKYRG